MMIRTKQEKVKQMRAFYDLRGMVFSRLTVIDRAGNDKYGSVLWRCICTCGKEVTVSSPSLRSGNSTSCGYYRRERTKEANTTHGMTKTSIHRCWAGLLNRCFNSNSKSWKYYGARGISVAPEWLNFQAFFQDVGEKPGPGYSIDRIDNDGNYEKNNVRWATWKEQANNRRKGTKSRNRLNQARGIERAEL